MGHGLDERHAEVFQTRRLATAARTQSTDLPPALCRFGKFPAGAFARRGRSPQRLALEQDVGRSLAEVRRLALALWLHGGPAGQEAVVHGRRVSPAPRVAPRPEPRLAFDRVSGPRGHSTLCARIKPTLLHARRT